MHEPQSIRRFCIVKFKEHLVILFKILVGGHGVERHHLLNATQLWIHIQYCRWATLRQTWTRHFLLAGVPTKHAPPSICMSFHSKLIQFMHSFSALSFFCYTYSLKKILFNNILQCHTSKIIGCRHPFIRNLFMNKWIDHMTGGLKDHGTCLLKDRLYSYLQRVSVCNLNKWWYFKKKESRRTKIKLKS